MDALSLRQRYLEFFRQHDHAVIGAAPLVPENDPSVLFTTAGMHPLVPFLLGEPHPAGQRLVDFQPCLRTVDILEVGDLSHLTLFEMLGNWSLGDYWKETAIRLNFALLTEVFGHDPQQLWVTCFSGDADAPRDEEAAAVWRELGIPSERIVFLPKSDNWWGPAGITGPCGPDSEVFFDTNPRGPSGETPGNTPGRFWELANNVFMAYERRDNGSYLPLAQRNVDVGVGLERNLMVLQGVGSAFETDAFAPIMNALVPLVHTPNTFALRVVADHLRASMLLLAEGIRPGNTDQPYIARRLIRRAIRYGHVLGIEGTFLARLAEAATPDLTKLYPILEREQVAISTALDDEEHRFQRTLVRGERELARVLQHSQNHSQTTIDGPTAFRLHDTFGFPLELTEELASQVGITIDHQGFAAAQAVHQEQSRQGAAGRFKGGLTEQNPATTRLHTATHLLQAGLRRELGTHITQRGSNITTERLRFDFNHPERVSPEQLAEIERWVNQQISADLPVCWEEMSVAEAREHGALGVFDDRYGERVKVYSIGEISREMCGGPHVATTSDLGHFRIIKEEAVAAGVRRIRAVLE